MRNKILTYIFILAITLTGLLAVVMPDGDITYSERRHLYSLDDLKVSQDFSGDFEKYALDQFPLRDLFRRFKAFAEYSLFKKKDNNGLYKYDGSIISMLYPLNEKSVVNLSDKINKIIELYAEENVYYALIPDKNYFVDGEGYLRIDYAKMQDILTGGIAGAEYIDLFGTLGLGDYYRTDHHFKIDSLGAVLTALAEGLDVNLTLGLSDYKIESHYPFYGAYYGQAAMDIDADTLLYVRNEMLDECTVRIWEGFDKYTDYKGLYDFDKLGSVDSYDMFLYGTKPVVEIHNPSAAAEREIIIFKDSFTNSLAPLIIQSYSKITLVDLRLVNHTILDSFVDFEDADILFLYSTMIANDSYILK